ncbi:MAG: 2-isopropylmalate synthase [Myxococcota bacterium]
MADLAKDAALDGRLVIWEECARDGAQARTLLSAEQRVEIARASGALFGSDGPRHVIFAAGFPSVCPQEFDVVRELVARVDNCTLATHGRATEADIMLGIRSLRGAAHGRVTFFVPVSSKFCSALGLGSPQRVRAFALDRLAFALDHADGLPVDVALADTARAEPEFVADLAMALGECGTSIVKLCDSAGVWYPNQCRAFVQQVLSRTQGHAVLGVHHHNDLGFAAANNLAAIELGIRIVASSWLGLGERAGLAATEQMIFSLAYEPHTLEQRLGHPADFWSSAPRLNGLVPLARRVSEALNIPRRSTDPVVGTGVNQISTGTPFRASSVVQPFDPDAALGVPRELVLTQLANRGIIAAVADELGFDSLSTDELDRLLAWVKSEAYRTGHAIVPKSRFVAHLQAVRRDRSAGATAG